MVVLGSQGCGSSREIRHPILRYARRPRIHNARTLGFSWGIGVWIILVVRRPWIAWLSRFVCALILWTLWGSVGSLVIFENL